jgi:hypothetical protein
VAAGIEALLPASRPSDEKKQPKRAPLPPHLPLREIRHEPQNTTCGCGQAMQQRQKVPAGSATAKAIDYSLKRWEALTRYIDDGELPIDNNWVENQIRQSPWAETTGCSPAACAPASGPLRS